MDDLKVEHLPLNVIPVTEYDPFEAKFAASLYWLVFCATEDGEFENIPSQVTSPIQRDCEKRITVRPEVIEFLTNGEIYCKVCDSIFRGKVPVVGQWAIIQTLSRHGFYVVEEGDIAVTDSALQQRKPFRKSTHLALMDCLMSAFSAQAVSVQQVVQSVSKFSSFNASKELPFDLEDALLLWINKICAALNDNQLKKQKQHAEQLLQNQDKAKRFRFRRDQLQPKVQTEFPVMEDLLKDISDGQSLLGIVMFYHPTVVSLEDIRFDKNLSTEDCVHNLDLFRSLCSQFICTSVLALKLEDLLYGSQAMKPNVIALLAEIFNKCKVESTSPENGVNEKTTSKSDVDLQYIVANKENVMDNRSSSAPVLNSDKNKGIEHESPREMYKGKNERFSYISGQLRSSSSDRIEQINSSVWKSQSDSQMNSNSRLSFKSPFQLDFTVDDDIQQPLNGPLSTQDVHEKEKENPFSGIFQRPVLAGDRKRSTPNMLGAGGSPRATPRQEHSLLMRRNKQKQRTLDLEEWDMQQEELEDLQLNDIQRSQSLTGLDKAKVEPRQSFHAWREDTGASLSDTNLASSRNEKISLDFRPKLPTSAPQRGTEGSIPQRGAEGIPFVPSGLKAKCEEHSSHDSLSSTDSLNMAPSGDKLRDSLLLGVRDSCMSDISTKELNQFEEIEAQILAGKSVETPRTFVKSKNKLSKAPIPQEDEDELNTSVNSEDMDMFRLEVLQRLTEDKLQQIPDGAEMEDDDPILLARSNAASGSNPSDERARLEVPDAPADDPTDQLSPITETSEPVVSNPNSVSSANSTAPSSPCSPLDVAPFMPEFFTTSPANSLDRKSKRFSMKTREDSDATLVGEDDDEFTCEPVTSVTPRFQTKSGDKNGLFPVKSKSFEQLARGSYTVSHVSEDSAKAAGIPVIGTDGPVTEPGFPVESGVPVTEAGTSVFSTEARGRTESVTSTSAHQELSKVSQNSRDLSGFRPLILSSDGVELIGGANEGVDGRRDSLETSPAHSPAFTRGKRVDAHQEAVLQSRGMTTQDSPSDVVIFERSLSNPLEGRTPLDASCAETRENAQYNPGTVTRSSKSEAYVFDFNQDTVEHYKNGHKTQDFRTYKKSQLSGQAQNEVPQGDQRAASVNEDTAEQRFQGAQKDAHIGTYSKNSHSDEREQSAADSLDGRHRQRISEEARGSVVSVKDLRQSDGFSTFRKDSTSELKNFAVVSSAHALDLRRSDGFTTFRKQVKQVSDAALERQRFSMASTHDQRSSEADRFSTFAKSAKKQSDAQNYAKEGLRHFHETTSSGRADLQQATMTARAPSSVGGESDRQTSPRGVEEEQIRPSGSPNLTRSRTFRKTPDGQIIDDRSSVGNNEDNSSASRDSRLPGRNVIATNRVSSPGTVVTLTDDTEVRVRLTRQVDASADRSESSPTNSPRRPSSPRQTGRGSPVETITWVDSAKSLTDRVKQPRCMCGKRDACADRTTAQDSNPTSSPRRRSSPRQTGRGIPVETITWGDSAKSLVLNNRGCMQEDTRTELFADELSGHERPHFIATEVIHQRVLHQNEASPWQQGGTEHSRLCAAPRVFPSSHNEEQTPVMTSGLLLNGNTSTAVDNELKPRETRVDASSPTSEPDTRGGGSIRDRIAALTAAAGVSRLDVSPGREQSRVDITPGKEQSRMDITPGKEQSRVDVTPGKEQSRMDITPGGEQSRLDVTPGKEQSRVDVTPGSEQSTVTAEKGVAFDVEFQKAPKPRPPPRVTSRFSTKDLDRKDVTVCETWVVNNRELEAVNNREFEAVNNKDLGVVRDKSVAFEVSFDDEPQSKRSKDETGLLQSPFKAFRTRSNRRHQYQSSVKLRLQRTNMGEGSLICMQNDDCKENGSISTFSSDAGLVQKATSDQLSVDITSSKRATPQEDVKDRSNSKVSNLEKRNTFTLDLVSQFTENTSGQGLPVVEVFDKLVSKEESKTVNEQQQGSNSGLPKLHKRNTFTLDLDSEYTGDASKQGLSIAKALNELANKEEFNNPKENYLPSEHLQKRNTFTLDSASGEGVDIAAVLNDLASEEEMKQNKQLSVVPDGPTQKRGTFTLDSVSQSIQSASMEGVQVATVLNDLASKEELKQNKQQSDVDISSETSQKRSTFTLDCVSRDIDSAIEKYFPNECANFTSEDSTRAEKQDASEKRSTYTLDLVSLSLQSGVNEGLPVEEVLCQLATHEELQSSRLSSAEESAPKRGTFTFDSVSQTLEDAEKKGLSASEVLSHLAKQEEFESSSESVVEESAPKRETITFDSVSQTLEDAEEKGLSASEVLSQLAKQEELESTSESAVEESVQKRGTFALDSVSQTLKEAQCNGLPALEAPHQLASEGERHSLTDTHPSLSNPPQNRGTYTLDTVSHAIQEAVEKGIPVSVTLNHLAQEEKSQRHSHAHDCNDATASEFAQGLRRPDTRALSPEARDEFEASFEDALEQLEDCVTWDNGEAFPTSTTCERPSSEAPGNRGTFDLDNVSTSLQDGAPVVETLERLSRTSGLPKDGIANNQTSQAKRGTYTLDEVSRSLQIASEQGIPVVDVLQHLTRVKEPSSESEEIKQGVGKRGTYTLNEVSKSLEHAEESGIPVIDALEALSKDKPKSTLRLKIPERGTDHRETYTLDKVSHSLEHATQKGLPVVDALGQLTASKESPVHRRQVKLINRKTYALASPLETIGEGAKLRLYDGSKKQMMSPISFHLKTKEAIASKPSGNDSKARGVVQKLDFLTSACELLLEANAKEMVRDPQGTESTPNNPTSDESVQGSHRAPSQAFVSQPDRNTYSLESVSSTIDDAKAKGIPVVETLSNVTSDVNPNATQRTNHMRLNSKSDSELINEESGKESENRYTHSLENVSRTLEDAKKAGIPVIQALDQLTNELAEFSLTAMSGNFPITQSGKDNRKRKRYSETAINGKKEQSPNPSPHGSPYPSPIRKAYSLDDVAFAVQQAFQSGTSLTDFLDGIAFEEPAEPVMVPLDVRPRSVDSGFVSSFSDNDISSQSIESPGNRSKTFVLNSSNEELDLTKLVSPAKETSFHTRNTTGSSYTNQDENRRTFTFDDVGKLTRDVPVIEALEKLSNSAGLKADNTKQLECNVNANNMSTDATLASSSNTGRKKSPPKPKRQFFKKKKSAQSNSDSFVIEFFDSNGTQEANASKFQIVDNKVEQVTDAEKDLKETENKVTTSSICSMQNNSENTKNDRQVPLDKHFVDTDMVPTRDPGTVRPKSKEPIPDSSSAPARGRATWRSSGSVLDQIASLMDAAEDSGMSPTDVLTDVTDLRADGEIDALQQDDADDDPVLAAKLANLRVQLAEKRRQIEAMKSRRTVEQEDQHRKMMDTLYGHVINKARGGQTVGEGPASEVLDSRKPVTEFPDQPTPPIAWSSPANSPLPASASHPSSNGQQFETREFRLSEYPPGNDLATKQDMTRPTSQPAFELSSRPTPVPPRPSSHDPAGSRHTAPVRKCWDVDLGQIATPPPLIRPGTASVNMATKQETVSPEGGDAAEIEVENLSPLKKGLAMFIGDDESQGLTPEQEKKREKFMRLRQKKQEEDRTRKEAELERKRKRNEKQHEKVMLQKMEEQRLRREEVEQRRAEQELRIRKTEAARVPDSYATYRRQGPRPQVYDVSNDVNSHFVPSPAQSSGFAEFSGPQCYVKPSGKSNRKIIVNAISHVCLSGTVNQDQKEKCLQAISESDGHHFMILFKDGLKFRGIYVHNLDNDQLYKVFGIGPRVVTSKMFEFIYKYNSGAKEFTKIPSKTISISVDGFAIQKSCWSTGKPVVPSKTASNFKKPPRPPQR